MFSKMPIWVYSIYKNWRCWENVYSMLNVDDLIYIGRVVFEKFKESMILEFDISDLGLLYYFINLEVIQFDVRTFICQK